MKQDLLRIVAFIAILVTIVLMVSGEPTSHCIERIGACSVYTGI